MTTESDRPDDSALFGHWPLDQHTNDQTKQRSTKAVDVTLGETGPTGQSNTASRFNGHSSHLEVSTPNGINFSKNPFTLSLWVNSDESTDIVGDLISQFDVDTRRGLNLSVVTLGGMTSTTQSNRRQIQFGIDDAKADADWQDAGRPGHSILASAMLVCQEQLFVGTIEIGADDIGQVYRYDGAQRWTQIGHNPIGCNGVHSLTEFNGDIYASTGRYMTEGSALGPTLNTNPGGKVFRIDHNGQWHDAGHPGLEGATPDHVETAGYPFCQ